jgi:hypothetical protein
MSSIPVVYNAKFNPSLSAKVAASIISDLSIPPATGLTINIIFFFKVLFLLLMKIINFQYASKVVNKMRPILKLYRGYANEQELIVMGHVLNQLKKGLRFSFKKI